MKELDYLIVGAGLYGSVLAHELKKHNKTVAVIEKEDYIGGKCQTQCISGIMMHKFGAHIFHTSNKSVWNYINNFGEFNHFINSPIACNNNKMYNLPFNMNTFNQVFGVTLPNDAKNLIQNSALIISNPKNLEEKALSLVGPTIYKLFIKDYTEKQWGKPCTELSPEIITRLPLRFIYDNNYFNDTFQGIPILGYTDLINNLLSDVPVKTGTYISPKKLTTMAKHIIYTGPIDEFFKYKLGQLEYRSLKFNHKIYNMENKQGVAVINYTSNDVPYTRTIEHKHFNWVSNTKTIVTTEYPSELNKNNEPYYPINNEKNDTLYNDYLSLSKGSSIYFRGRLGSYKYMDMDDTVEDALNFVNQLI